MQTARKTEFLIHVRSRLDETGDARFRLSAASLEEAITRTRKLYPGRRIWVRGVETEVEYLDEDYG